MQVHFEGTFSPHHRLNLQALVVNAYALLQRHYPQLPPGAAGIDTAIISENPGYLGYVGGSTMHLSAAYLEACTIPWLASLFEHEGTHKLNAATKYAPEDLWQNELSACEAQMRVGLVVGFEGYELHYLHTYMGNKPAMEAHMVLGYKGP